ncbi:MAG: sulfite exporter TauE/SafE family protein [Planctomycetes bacterium]|nr:sulfite exporter TauE/SafE family protein [Planctomycetota bacterium]NUQ35108.1 sulfite exporter TauE/SafE family protein [Planctomycetaceae bacterium]
MDTPTIIYLSIAACLTSIITASAGIGGGLVLVALMTPVLPTAAVIPVHGVVQLASNGSRMTMSLPHVQWKITLQLWLGAIVGAAAAAWFLIQLDEQMFGIVLGSLILVLIWLPMPTKRLLALPRPFIGLGAISAYVSHFAGGTGPILAPFLAQACKDRFALISTEAASQMLTHTLKIFVFGFFVAGFSFTPYLWPLLWMVIGAFIGTWIGTKILGKISERVFRWIFSGVTTALAVVLIVRALLGSTPG